MSTFRPSCYHLHLWLHTHLSSVSKNGTLCLLVPVKILNELGTPFLAVAPVVAWSLQDHSP